MQRTKVAKHHLTYDRAAVDNVQQWIVANVPYVYTCVRKQIGPPDTRTANVAVSSVPIGL